MPVTQTHGAGRTVKIFWDKGVHQERVILTNSCDIADDVSNLLLIHVQIFRDPLRQSYVCTRGITLIGFGFVHKDATKCNRNTTCETHDDNEGEKAGCAGSRKDIFTLAGMEL